MSISSEISRISGNVSAALTAIAAKGVTVPPGSNSDDLADLIALIGPNLTTKSITLNGTYAASSEQGAPDGFSSVTVNVQNGASMTEVQNQYGTELVITSAQGAGPSATQHTITLGLSDDSTVTIPVYYDNSLIGTMITAYNPSTWTYNGLTVYTAELDGVEWYDETPTPTPSIPLNTQLIDYNAVTDGVAMYNDGSITETEWMCVSDYTAIDPSMTFTIVGNPWYGTGFYDSSKALISAVITNELGGVLNSSNIPAGAAWVRISAVQGADDTELSLIRTA